MPKTARVQVNVEVTPKIRQGNAVFCEIDPAPGTPPRYVRGGIIKLPSGDIYEVNFRMQAGDVGALQFDNAGPFWSNANACPAPGANNVQFKNPRVDPAGTTLTVDVDPAGPKNAVHYSLNFNGGASCDPIIINN